MRIATDDGSVSFELNTLDGVTPETVEFIVDACNAAERRAARDVVFAEQPVETHTHEPLPD